MPSNLQAATIDGELDEGQPPPSAPDISSTSKNGSAEPRPTGRLSNRDCYLKKPRAIGWKISRIEGYKNRSME